MVLAGYVLPLVGGGMILVNTTIFLEFFPRTGARPTTARAAVVAFFLVATAGFWAGLLYGLLHATLVGFAVALLGMNVLATTPLVWIGVRAWGIGERSIDPKSHRWPVVIALSLTGGEALMGATFAVAGGGGGGWSGAGGLAIPAAVGIAATSPWFFWGMLGAMVPLLFWVPLPRGERHLLLGLNATGLTAPFVITDPWWGAVGMASVMGATLVVLVLQLNTDVGRDLPYLRTSFGVVGGFGLMNAGLLGEFALSLPWGRFAFALAGLSMMAGEMVLLIPRVLREYR